MLGVRVHVDDIASLDVQCLAAFATGAAIPLVLQRKIEAARTIGQVLSWLAEDMLVIYGGTDNPLRPAPHHDVDVADSRMHLRRKRPSHDAGGPVDRHPPVGSECC